MNLPFTAEQFLGVFGQYNNAVWPCQVFLNLIAVAALFFIFKPFDSSNRLMSGILALLWIWIGVVYHFIFFTSINPAAYIFGAANVIQGLIFIGYGVFRSNLLFCFRKDLYGIAGLICVFYALIIYPILGFIVGHVYPTAPTFGLPCPTTIFTFGVLLLTNVRIPKIVLVIPFLWSWVGFSAALTMGIWEDVGLLVAGIAGFVLIILKDRRIHQSEN